MVSSDKKNPGSGVEGLPQLIIPIKHFLKAG